MFKYFLSSLATILLLSRKCKYCHHWHFKQIYIEATFSFCQFPLRTAIEMCVCFKILDFCENFRFDIFSLIFLLVLLFPITLHSLYICPFFRYGISSCPPSPHHLSCSLRLTAPPPCVIMHCNFHLLQRLPCSHQKSQGIIHLGVLLVMWGSIHVVSRFIGGGHWKKR